LSPNFDRTSGGWTRSHGPADPDPVADPRTVAAILRSAPHAVVLFDVEGLIVDWSPAAERLLGYSRGEAVGRDLLELIFPARLHAAIETVIASRGSAWGEAARRAIEINTVTRAGEERPVEMTLSWASGAELFVVHLTDRSDRGDRERELARDAERRAAVNELGRGVIGPSDLERLLRDTRALAVEYGGLESCELWDLDHVSGELRLRCSTGPRFEWADPGLRTAPAAGSRLAEALRDDERVVVGDLLLPDPLDGPRMLEATEQPGTPGIAVIVSGSEGQIGVLTGAARPGAIFTRDETEHLTSLSLIVASAIERDRFVNSITEAETRLRGVIERLPAITYRAGLGSQGQWHFVSPQVEEIFGFTVAECMERRDWWEQQMHPEDLERVIAEEERCAAAGEALDVEYRIRDRHGRMLWIRDRASIGRRSDRAQDEVVVDGLMVDVTSQKLSEQRLRHDAEHDVLTGLLNRRGFESRLDERLGSGARYDGGFVAVIDIDHMKRLNDALGHAAGDAFLRGVAKELTAALDGGQIAGRLSSDEFVIYAPALNELEARDLLTRISARISTLPTPLALTASIGAAMVTPPRTAADLLVGADLALYGSKREGRSRITIDPDTVESGLDWLSRVRTAIEARSLAVFSQPIFDLRTGRRQSEELLVRMLGDNGRPIAAEQFVPAAERFGLIQQIDRFVVERALEAVAVGRPVNVNVSAASLGDRELTGLVANAFSGAPHIDPSLLTFEITETGPTPELDTLRGFSERVAALGCALSLDDVGTGFGSLTYLQNLHFDEIKIDGRFVRGLEHDSEADEGIIRSLVALAHELDLQTVGEAVGSERIRRRLVELGVSHGQGYHLGPPAPLVTIPTSWQPT
jgi:diguanylate cyclase (GGDEF)-like protein/PAS domain S-box-containing protein